MTPSMQQWCEAVGDHIDRRNRELRFRPEGPPQWGALVHEAVESVGPPPEALAEPVGATARAERAFMEAAYEREAIFVTLTSGASVTASDRARLGEAKAKTYDAWLALRAARAAERGFERIEMPDAAHADADECLCGHARSEHGSDSTHGRGGGACARCLKHHAAVCAFFVRRMR